MTEQLVEPRIITLSARDLKNIHDYAVFAHETHERAAKKGIVTERIVAKNMTPRELNVVGFAGEYVVAKETGTKLRWDRTGTMLKDDGIDLFIHDVAADKKHATQVKASANKLRSPQFYFERLEEFTADVGIYVQQLSENDFRIWGCISRQKFMRDYYVKDFRGYGDHYCVDADTMTDIGVLGFEKPYDHTVWWEQWDYAERVEPSQRRYKDPPPGSLYCDRCMGGGCPQCDWMGWEAVPVGSSP